MANYAQKLANMRSRRLGLDSGGLLGKSIRFAEAAALSEAYESRTKAEATKYALGAMQALEPKYTQISIQEGERVRNQLEAGLGRLGTPVTFDYQGSVPLDIHIRFASDIDLLVLHGRFVTFDSTGAGAYTYGPWTGSIIDSMLELRRQCEKVLAAQFPAVTVDTAGAKSITLTGGSLQRKVDVVPSHWHDTAVYQVSKAKHDREVRILNRDERTLLMNRPFLHMRRIEEKDLLTSGGAKKVIRLLKNIKKDSDREIGLSSYDIAALVWHFDTEALNKPYYLELSLVAEAQSYLQRLIDDPATTMTMEVPDRSRKIIDSSDKLVALFHLKLEVDELAADIAREVAPLFYSNGLDAVRKTLMGAYVY